MPESLSKYHLKRLRKTKASYKKIYSWLSSKRYLADSNCCNRFCRPVPNHSAKVPLFWTAKIVLFWVLSKHNPEK